METKNTINNILKYEIDEAEDHLKKMKREDLKLYNNCIDHLKVRFIMEKDIIVINKIAILFSSLKLHSTVPLIISKLINEPNGGTLLYSLQGLKINSFHKEIEQLRTRKISFEMKEMIDQLKIKV